MASSESQRSGRRAVAAVAVGLAAIYWFGSGDKSPLTSPTSEPSSSSSRTSSGKAVNLPDSKKLVLTDLNGFKKAHKSSPRNLNDNDANRKIRTVRFVTWNVFGAPETSETRKEGVYNNPKNVEKGIKDLIEDENVNAFAFQEMHNPKSRKLAAAVLKKEGFVCTQKATSYKGSSPASVPVCLDTDVFDVHALYSIESTGRYNDNGPVSPKFISVAEAKITDPKNPKGPGVEVAVSGTHAVATVERDGMPNENTKRNKKYAEHITKWAEVNKVEQEEGRTTVANCDCNVGFKVDEDKQYGYYPYTVFGRQKMYSSYEYVGEDNIKGEKASQHGRLIDYSFFDDSPNLRVISVYISPKRYGSDHHPVITEAEAYV